MANNKERDSEKDKVRKRDKSNLKKKRTLHKILRVLISLIIHLFSTLYFKKRWKEEAENGKSAGTSDLARKNDVAKLSSIMAGTKDSIFKRLFFRCGYLIFLNYTLSWYAGQADFPLRL